MYIYSTCLTSPITLWRVPASQPHSSGHGEAPSWLCSHCEGEVSALPIGRSLTCSQSRSCAGPEWSPLQQLGCSTCLSPSAGSQGFSWDSRDLWSLVMPLPSPGLPPCPCHLRGQPRQPRFKRWSLDPSLWEQHQSAEKGIGTGRGEEQPLWQSVLPYYLVNGHISMYLS